MAFSFTTLVRRAGLLAGALGGASTVGAQVPPPSWQPVTTVAAAMASSGGASVSASAIDAAGSVYVAGYFAGTVSVGGVSLTSAGGNDVFVAKWSPGTQSFAWVRQSGGTGSEYPTALATTGGQVYVAGYFENTAGFGGSPLTSAGSADAFVAKLTDAGSSATWAWAQRAGGAGFDEANALAVSGAAVYAVGTFAGTAGFGSATYTSAGPSDAFLTRLTDAGPSAAFAWTQVVGGFSNDLAAGVAAQGSTVYVTGLFLGTAAFGSISLSTSGPPALFVAKLADAGTSATYTWVQQASGTSIVMPNALVLQGSQLYVAGRFQGTATFGTISVPNATTAGGAYDAFVAKLADAGATASFVWAYGAGGPLSDYANALAVRGNRVYLAGGYSGTASFGNVTISSSGTSDDAFVARLTDLGPLATFNWAQTAGGTGTDNALALAPASVAVYVGGWVYGAATFGSQSVGTASQGQSGFFTAIVDAIDLATLPAASGAAAVAVFPTPAAGGALATVQLPLAAVASPVALTVLDGLGRVVRTRTATQPAGSTQVPLDVAGLAPGVYALRVAVGERLGTARLVVE